MLVNAPAIIAHMASFGAPSFLKKQFSPWLKTKGIENMKQNLI